MVLFGEQCFPHIGDYMCDLNPPTLGAQFCLYFCLNLTPFQPHNLKLSRLLNKSFNSYLRELGSWLQILFVSFLMDGGHGRRTA